MARIKIKCRPPSRDKKLKLIEILSIKDIEISRVITTNDGYVVLTTNEEHADSIFNPLIKTELTNNGLTPVIPPELKAKKSVIIPRVDDVIYERDTLETGEELAKVNQWIDIEDIESVFKFPNSPTIKITFTQTAKAKKCTEAGLKAFKISIPGYEIKTETYIPVKCCMKCYQLESHFTNECPKDRDYKICSECSTIGHQWHQCKAVTKTCINCGEGHSTMAMKCKLRKSIIKDKRQRLNEASKKSYANVSQPSASTNPTSTPIVTKEEILKIHICVAHAKSKEQENPGTYSTVLNNVLKANKLPTIIIPDDDTIPVNSNNNAASASSQINITPEPATRTSLGAVGLNSHINDSNESNILEAEDLGLEFLTTKETGWPKNFSTPELIKGIRKNKYKYRYTSSEYSEEYIINKVERGEIKINRCLYTLQTDEFRKIRPGLVEQRSQREDRDPRLRRHSNE